jgi:hypothetical protein
MRLRWWRRDQRPASDSLAEARRQRAQAELRLAEARQQVIIPLRELREKNHVSEAITMLIQRRAGEQGS